MRILCVLLAMITCMHRGTAQDERFRTDKLRGAGENASQPQYDRNGRPIPNNNRGNDSLKRRDNTDDSITIYFRYFDSTRIRTIDSSVSNFYDRFPLSPQYVTLGNLGTAARSLVFRPLLKPGWDPGFHALDPYRFGVEDTRFYQTTRPYSELGYMIGGKAEQMVNIIHTQNIKPDFNMAFQYRFINAPGNFQNQNASHNNFRINGVYQSNNKRYTIYGIFFSNRLHVSENGGIINPADLDKTGLNDPFTIPTRLGGTTNPQRNPFNTRIRTGNLYDETTLLFRQQYDIGQKDSLRVNDSTLIRLFYPRLRLQHNFRYASQNYRFQDYTTNDTIRQQNYRNYFRISGLPDTVLFADNWKEVMNDFSLITFPEKNNLNQFFKVGVALQNLQLTGLSAGSRSYYNLMANGEYRNRTRNQKWNIEAQGQLYFAGLNSGDYSAQLSLKRLISVKLGYLEAGFQNVNRTPSFIYGGQTNYPVTTVPNLNKENITRVYGSLSNAARNFTLAGEYYLVSNYTYFDDFFKARQEATLFNVLHVSAEKKFRLNRKWNLYSELHVQQTQGNPPLNLPLAYTINRIAHETTPFKNLVLSYGLEFRYATPYRVDNYSPFTGQFFYQDTTTVNNRPEITAFLNFRIRSFKAFVRAENLNTLRNNEGLGFTKSNFYVPYYPTPGLWIRVGIWWSFVN